VTVSENDAPADTSASQWDFIPSSTTEPVDDADLGQAVREAGDELSRTTLRLVNRLKAQAEHAANRQGVSLNT
jgi:hypothetical protein